MAFNDLPNDDGKIHVVLFYGANCAPCKSLKPKLQRVCAELEVSLVELDASTEREAIASLGLRIVPTVAMVRGRSTRVLFTGDFPEEGLRLNLVSLGVPLP